MRLGRLAIVVAMAAAGLATAEVVHRRAAQGGPADHAGACTEAIIVLGYRSERDGTPSPVQRWRCQIAVRSIVPSRSSTLIMSGWNGEAEVMAAYTHDVLGVPADHIAIEKQARSTWENIAYSLPIAQDYDVIKIASDPLHARRARRYIARLRPDLLPRLEPATAYRLLEHPVLKAGTFGYELLRPLVRRARNRGGRHASHARRPKRPLPHVHYSRTSARPAAMHAIASAEAPVPTLHPAARPRGASQTSLLHRPGKSPR